MPGHTSSNTSSSSARVLKTLLLVDLVDSTVLVESLGDYRAAELFARCDSLARNLLAQHDGTEIDKTDGFLLIFDRPIDAVRYALNLHEALVSLSDQTSTKLAARAGIHLGEIMLRENPPEHVARGAKPLEVEGLAKPMAARLMSLAQGGRPSRSGRLLIWRGAEPMMTLKPLTAFVGSTTAPTDSRGSRTPIPCAKSDSTASHRYPLLWVRRRPGPDGPPRRPCRVAPVRRAEYPGATRLEA